MAERNDGGPAFPESYPDHPTPSRGMALRDYFAGQALLGERLLDIRLSVQRIRELNDGAEPIPEDDIRHSDKIANACYLLADAMLDRRKQPE